MYADDVGLTWFFSGTIYSFFFSYKRKFKSQIFAYICSIRPKCRQNFKILQLAWTLTPNKFWTKCIRCLIFTQTVFHSVHWGINLPSKTLPPLSCQAPLKSAKCPGLPFLGNSPLYIGFFMNPTLKIQFFSELQKYSSFSSLTQSYIPFKNKFLVEIFLSTMKPERMKSLSEVGNEIYQLKYTTFSLF